MRLVLVSKPNKARPKERQTRQHWLDLIKRDLNQIDETKCLEETIEIVGVLVEAEKVLMACKN